MKKPPPKKPKTKKSPRHAKAEVRPKVAEIEPELDVWETFQAMMRRGVRMVRKPRE